jgi:xyloglucan-specific exo-beta-1,4-glucanase
MGGPIYVSVSNGSSWDAATEGPARIVFTNSVFYTDVVLASDPFNSSMAYALDLNGLLWTTSNGGLTWLECHQFTTGYPKLRQIVPSPTVTGEIWASMDTDGLWVSTNRGANFSRYLPASIERSRVINFGIARSGSELSTLYMVGIMTDQAGLWRLENASSGAALTEWTILPSNFSGTSMQGYEYTGTQIGTICASSKTFGRVFVGTGGRGIFYSAQSVPTPSAQPQSTPYSSNTPDVAPAPTAGKPSPTTPAAPNPVSSASQWKVHLLTILGSWMAFWIACQA